MALHGLICNLLSLGAKLLPVVTASAAQAPSSSSSPPAETNQIESDVERFMEILNRMNVTLNDAEGREISDESVKLIVKEFKLPANSSAQAAASSSSPPAENDQIGADLESLMKMLERIKATLYDAEERELIDQSVKLWLRELKGVASEAEDVLGDYHYEVLRAQGEARNAAPPNSRKKKQVQMPDGMFDQIKKIKDRFDEICKDRIALQLREEDGPRRCNSESQRAPTSHFVAESGIIGRGREKEELIDLLSSECHDSRVISVVTIVGTGGLGKTTLAKLAYNDQRIRKRFRKRGWVCVSEDFNVERLTRESIESITGSNCDLKNLSALQEKIKEAIRGKRVLLVLDDVWNENTSHWELFRAPFMLAALVKILVTTRNEPVARIMQTMPTFKLGYLSEEQCWRMFQHYAFGEVNPNERSELEEIGKQIIKKCGRLPLAIKSIASLLRHEVEEESWREILESQLWEISGANNEIFAPLQISYTRLPTHLKPCFLYCSMFPKDYIYSIEKLVPLWIYQGYIESNGKMNRENIGQEYAKQLLERSFFEIVNESNLDGFKMHDMVHDLARSHSDNGCYSIEKGKVLDFPKELYHLYIADYIYLIEPLPSGKLTALRTLIAGNCVENFLSTFDFSKAQKLRVLELKSQVCELEDLFSVVNLKHLHYLLLENLYIERLPECICFLYSLQNLTLSFCWHLRELPKSMGNLVSLEELIIDCCPDFRVLPVSLCQLKALTKLIIRDCSEFGKLPNVIGSLTNLRTLQILECDRLEELPSDIGSLANLQTLKISLPNSVRSLPPSLGKLTKIQRLKVKLECETMGWLEHFVNLDGTLCIHGLNNIPGLTDVKRSILVNMHNLESLFLCWSAYGFFKEMDSANVLWLDIKGDQNTFSDKQYDLSLMVRLQPHHNLRELYIAGYGGITFPNWIGNPTSCASLQKIVIRWCFNLTSLPFGSLCKLRSLVIYSCNRLQSLQAESLPLGLQELEIGCCQELISVPGIQKLQSLVKLCISFCRKVHWMDVEPFVERTNESWDHNSLLGLKNLTSLRSLQIKNCPQLQLLEDELLPVESCKVEVFDCPRIKEWCLQHSITYMEWSSADWAYRQI